MRVQKQRQSWASIFPALLLGASLLAAADNTPTYNRDVQPILQKNCVACHAPGKVAPMPFTTYESTRPWVRQIREMVTNKKMPPGVVERHYGLFGDDGSMNQNEIDVIVRWVDGGAPEGVARPARIRSKKTNH
ncbi:MAG: cytochrome c [Bryobacteraceae bacterium]